MRSGVGSQKLDDIFRQRVLCALPLDRRNGGHRMKTHQELAFVAGAATWLLMLVLADDASRSLFVVVALAGAGVIGLLLRWRQLLVLAVAMLFVEALVRRYLVNAPALFFFKDVLLGFGYLKYLLERRETYRKRPQLTPLAWAIAALAALVVLGVANPYLPAPAVGVLGLHSWLWYIPVAFLTRDAATTSSRYLRFIAAFAATALPLGALAVAQLHWPVLNKTYYHDTVGLTPFTVGSKVIPDRSVGAFASTGVFADYLVLVTAMLPTLAVLARTWRARGGAVLVAAGITMGVGGAASRGVAAATLVVVVLTAIAVRDDLRSVALVATMVAGFFLAAFTLYPELPGLYRAVQDGLATASIRTRFEQHVVDPLLKTPSKVAEPSPPSTGSRSHTKPPTVKLPASPTVKLPARTQTVATRIFGHGTGLGAAGREYAPSVLTPTQLAKLDALAAPEGGWVSVLWEFGVVGVLVVAGLFVVATREAWKAYHAARTAEDRALALAGLSAVVMTGVLMVLTTNLGEIDYTLLFWISVGLILAAGRVTTSNRLEKSV